MGTPKLYSQAALEETLALSAQNRLRIQILEKEMLAILKATEKMPAYKAAAERTRGLLPDATGRRALSAKTFQRLFGVWKKEGWTALAAEYATIRNRLPRPFILHWQKLYVRFKADRSGLRAHAELLAEWNRWRRGAPDAKPIPGYPVPPEEFGTTGAPFGWSARNLMRHLPDKIAVAAVKRGRHAAAELAPMVLTTRSGLEPGMCYMFDDVWHDLSVSFPGQRGLVRPIELGAIDVASGCKISYGLRPRIWTEGETKGSGHYEGLRGTDMAMVVADVLCNCGIHPDGCLLCVENGTAAISEAQEEFLARISNGKIRVQRGGIDNLPAFDGGFAGSPRGNSRFKAPLESLHNLFHNQLSCLPSYSGKDRTPPEDAQGEDYEFRKLIAQAAKLELPQDVIDRLSVGNISWSDFADFYAKAVEKINARTEHRLEGWERNLVTEVRLSRAGEWICADRALLGDAVYEALTSNPDAHRVRQASPLEVWRRGATKLQRVPFAAMIDFVSARNADGSLDLPVRKVSAKRQIVIRADALNPSGYVFGAFVKDARGNTLLLDAEREYKTILNPFAPRELIVLDMQDRYVGTAYDLVEKIAKTDRDALAKSAGIRRGQFARLLDPAHTLGEETRERRLEALCENARLVEQNRADALALAREISRENAAALTRDDALLDGGAETPPPAPNTPAADDASCDDFLDAVGDDDAHPF